MRKNEEYALSKAIATYLKLQYPGTIFRFDMAGLNLSMAQAGMNKAIQFGKAYPDLHILKGKQTENGYSNGLFLELKKEGAKLKKRNGEWVNDHIKEQAEMLELLNRSGYSAHFGIGFNETKELIDNYLKEWKK